ncbi:uncharacterized protein LOC124162081 isoform X2 [Ischnura elegans]|nr:uncharacterized protein LOC124162081 isoform X2 [Ischnura elegans]
MLQSLKDPSKPDLDTMMYYLRISGLTSCDENTEKACSGVCLEKVRQAGDSTDQSQNRPDGKTANQIGCLMLKGDASKRTNIIYARVCNKEWKPVYTINTNLCCRNKTPC